ncbi:MAG: polymer-forming cytoskeletal protein [Clostridiales Family XIII bacterium]|jgi:cytoskeletal protein CcmA (bactofilin family)|nr:polymer-forming cytoskeletal protein [Clostridiales Family XIII bacterium]
MGFMDSLRKSGDLFGGNNNEGDGSVAGEEKETVRAGTSEEKPEPGSFEFTDAETLAVAAEEAHVETTQALGIIRTAGESETPDYEDGEDGDDTDGTPRQTNGGLSNSHISEDTEIIGDINSKGNIEIRGKVLGDVATQGNIIVEGGIFGNVSGQNIGLYTCRIKGDVQATVDVMGDSGTVVLGNVNANNIVMDGKCKGVVSADNMLVIRGNSYLIGDITARSFVVDDGAVINGSIKTITNENLDAMFNISDGESEI